MQTVKVVYIGYISQLLGKRQEEISLPDNPTAGDILQELAKAHGETFSSAVLSGDGQAVDSWTRVLVDDRDIRNLQGLSTRVKEGAEVCVMALFEVPAGG
ncbi:MAG: MoaD/ThiS family protein [Chloroflexi bacterium]|nr:MoaD/ThiS family protein [Chloroflexota bacterium]